MNAQSEQVLLVQKIKAASMYKLLFVGLILSLVPLGIVFGVMGFYGADTVTWNNEPVHGTAAIFAGPAIGVFVTLMFTGMFGTLANLGLWILSRFRPISIRVVTHVEQ